MKFQISTPSAIGSATISLVLVTILGGFNVGIKDCRAASSIPAVAAIVCEIPTFILFGLLTLGFYLAAGVVQESFTNKTLDKQA